MSDAKKKKLNKNLIKAILGGSDKSGKADARSIDKDKKDDYYAATAGLPEGHEPLKQELPTVKSKLGKAGLHGVEDYVKDKKKLDDKSDNNHGFWSDYIELKESDMSEDKELHPNQKPLDVNDDGKISSGDLAMLRKHGKAEIAKKMFGKKKVDEVANNKGISKTLSIFEQNRIEAAKQREINRAKLEDSMNQKPWDSAPAILKNESVVDYDTILEEMTDEQKEKREKYVLAMKKKLPDFEEKYGDKALSVIYATATKMAMK